MKKEALILPLLLLTACAEMSAEDSEEFYDEGTYQNGAYAEESGLVLENQGGQTGTVQPVQNAQQPQMQQARISPDGTMIELPAQQIFLGEIDGGYSQPQAALPPLAYSEPGTVQSQPMPPQPPRAAMVTLQNVSYTNTYAQCAAEDTACIAAYEQQGYRRLNGTPQFAGYQDVLSHSDYPGNGQWRNGNNIPRW
ncbi:MAG: hypothetical protein IKS41_01005 [Alphaproteobacteria bacterium]|nr:hypothetical protein [Alphaproteobacteria bacterium]